MRILQVTPVTPESGGVNTGGIAIHAWGLATHLAARGHDVAVLADNRPLGEPWPETLDGVEVFGIKDFAGPLRRSQLSRPEAVRQILAVRSLIGRRFGWRWTAGKVAGYREVLERFHPDLIHVHGLENRTSFVHIVGAGRVPTVATMHSTHSIEFTDPVTSADAARMVRENLMRARDVVFVSEYLRDRCEEVLPGAASDVRAHVVPNPLDTTAHRSVERSAARGELGLEDAAEVVLFVGNLVARKDPLAFVEAVARLAAERPSVVGVIVGDGPQADEVRDRVDALRLPDAVRMVGFQPQERLAVYYGAADVFALPSHMESFGLVAVEAMLAGIPVIGSPEVLPEVVPDFAGSRVAPGDGAALAGALAKALDRDWDKGRIREHALGFDWDVRVGAFEELYGDLVARG